jgi:UDP-GlcNAc3NAcA epimerase
MKMPKEINPILTDRISKWLFTPNAVSSEHLRREGFDKLQIIPVGDVMLDVALYYESRVTENGEILGDFGLLPKNYILATIHRAENTNDHSKLINPLGCLHMVQLKKYSALIATDSGGVHKEAFFYGVPCITLRDETEWVELIESGWNMLAPPLDSKKLSTTILASLGSEGKNITPYGKGNAARLIVDGLNCDLNL